MDTRACERLSANGATIMVKDLIADDERTRQNRKRQNALELAVVSNVKDNANHQVRCRILSPRDEQNDPLTATVLVPMQGDVVLPSKGDIVVLATNAAERPVIVGTLYARGEAMPDYDKDERTISHPDTAAKVTIQPDGEILIESDSGDKVTVQTDGTVRVNDGTNPVVTDVSGSGVSSVTKSDDLQVP